MEPRQLCSSLLHKFRTRPSLGKRTHVLEVARRKALHLRESRPQILRQPLDHLGAPALFRLPRQNVAANLPVQQNQLAIDRQRRTLLGGMDAVFQLGQPVGVACGRLGKFDRRRIIHRKIPFCCKNHSLRALSRSRRR